MVRSAVYIFTLLCVAYGVAEACFWAVMPIGILFGGLGTFGLVLAAGAWVLLIKAVFGKALPNLLLALLHAYNKGAPSTFRPWRYALAIAAMLIVLFVVLPSLFGLHVSISGLSWVGSPNLTFIGRLTAIVLALAALPTPRKDFPAVDSQALNQDYEKHSAK